MISRIFFASLFLGMYSTGSSLSCKWIVKDPGDKMSQFSLHNKQALGLLDMMVSITNTTKVAEIEHNVAFPNRLYHQKSKATVLFSFTSLHLAVQHSSASWRASADEGNRTTSYTKCRAEIQRTSEPSGHSAETLEVIRNETKAHLVRADKLVSSLMTTNTTHD
uniref:Uncharacterized protein n=1 Tax=Pundamilia nyererei TaxID=303518 RepID=A0A3B4EZ01_9CICH